MPKSKSKVPKKWMSFPNIGSPIVVSNVDPPFSFISFKTPITGEVWGVGSLLRACPDLAMVVDLTATDRYYSTESLREEGVGHYKMGSRHGHVGLRGGGVVGSSIIYRSK